MRLTQVLFGHNIGRMIRRHWYVQGKLKPGETPSKEILKSYGYETVDINEVLFPREPKEKVSFIGLYDPEPPLNENHPDYQIDPCLIYKNEDVLLEGLKQAQALTNTVILSDDLPELLLEKEKKTNLSDEVHLEAERKILLSCLLEATQEKLPKRKDPQRPAWNFPREYGIISSRKNELLCKNLVTLCEQVSKEKSNKTVVTDAFFSVPIEAHNKKIQLELNSELTVTGSKKLAPFGDPTSGNSLSVPDLHPLNCTVSLKPYHFYKMQNIYPFNINSKWPFLNLVFVYYDNTVVQNIFEEEVTETQVTGRSLMEGFAAAAAQARAMFGNDVATLPEPVVVPVVQTDGKMFHFSVYQLNTLQLDSDSECKNIFWDSQRIPLYQTCEYEKGKPIIKDFNPDVVKRLCVFYNIAN